MSKEDSPPPGSSACWASADQLLFSWLGQPDAQVEAHLAALSLRDPAAAAALQARVRELRRLGAVLDPESADTAPRIGTEFGDYRILRLLGKGGMGTVYLAEQRALGRRVALKVIRSDRLVDPASRERFRREARAVANLRHPGICGVLEVGEVEDTPFLAMQYIDGETLHDRLAAQRASLGTRPPRRRPSTADEIGAILEWIEQVARSLHAAHEAGVVHRDVKPGNVMIDRNGQVVILDFGLAQLESAAADPALTVTGDLLGTPAYMAPEQVQPRGHVVDRRTDVYSLGVTLFECLTLERPFLASTQLELYERIVRDPTPDPRRVNPHLPVDLSAVLAKAMEKEPARRYATAAELADELARVRRREPVRARRLGAVSRSWRWARRNPMAACLVASLVIGLAASISLLWLSRQRGYALQSTATILAARTSEFGMLANGVLLEQLREAESRLYPAWPEQTAAMTRWLDRDVARVLAEVSKLRETLPQLEKRALPLGVKHELRIAAAPEHARLVRAQTQAQALRRWRALRAGLHFELPELPAELRQARLGEVCGYAWKRLQHHDDERTVFGEEAIGLASALRAAELLEEGARLAEDPPWAVGVLVAWGWFFNGQIEKAKVVLEELRAEYAGTDASKLLDHFPPLFAKKEHLMSGPEGDKLLANLDAIATEVRIRLERSVREFDDPADQFLYRCLAKIDVESADLQRIDVPAVERRRAWSMRTEDLTLSHPLARVSWRDAIDCIRKADDIVASSAYGDFGARLEPQLDLVPLGMNPTTKLWEFYHLPSAYGPMVELDPAELPIPTVAEVNAPHGLTGSHGIVFVLLPGGTFHMGTQRDHPDQPNYDAASLLKETPVHEVSLDGFFLAKHELTQGQWMRMSGGARPSKYAEGYRTEDVVDAVTAAHPVETVDWKACVGLLERFGLTLPTEAQWEYGCRAGTVGSWSSGDEVKGLIGVANVFDRRFAKITGFVGPTPAPISQDGFLIHAPVGSLAPNAFGLFDMHGNVSEWCGDMFGSYELALESGTGARAVPPHEDWPTRRGGSFDSHYLDTRSGSRVATAPTLRTSSIGLRAARRVLRR